MSDMVGERGRSVHPFTSMLSEPSHTLTAVYASSFIDGIANDTMHLAHIHGVAPWLEPVPLTPREMRVLRFRRFRAEVREYFRFLGYALRGDALYTADEYDANGEY